MGPFSLEIHRLVSVSFLSVQFVVIGSGRRGARAILSCRSRATGLLLYTLYLLVQRLGITTRIRGRCYGAPAFLVVTFAAC